MWSFKLTLGILFGLLIASITVLSIVSYRNNQSANETAFLVTNTYEILDQVEEISSLYKDLQLESNALIISGSNSAHNHYKNAKEGIFTRVDNLRYLTRENPLHQRKIDSLEHLVKKLVEYTDSVLSVTSPGSYTSANLLSRVENNLIFRSKIRRIINGIKSDERKVLASREHANEKSINAFRDTFFLLLIGIGCLLATTFLLIRYNFNKRIRVQQDLKKANELFEKLFYESPIGIVITRIDNGVIKDCNNAYLELFNFSKEEIIGKTPVDLGVIPDQAQQNEIVKVALEKGVVSDMEMYLHPRKRDPIWASISMQPLQVRGKNCLLSAILDMTAHKQAEEKIKKALETEVELNRMKSNFVTLASHEFRTPLTTILSSAFLLENYFLRENQEKAMKHLARIKSSVKNLTSILDEFLSLTKIEEGKIQPNLERLNLKQYVETVCQNLRMFVKPGQEIIYTHNGEEEIYSDPVLLGNILNNLISNAIKYSNESSIIRVSSLVNNHVELEVKDSGIGISEEDQKNLFNRFYRGSNASNVQGTGLGLHIMKHYVDMLHGSIQVKSQPGEGSTFNVTFERTEA